MANELMEGVCERLEPLVDTLCEPVLIQNFDEQKLVDFQYNVFSTLYALSDSGLMDHNFDANPSGFLHHQSLGIMWDILGRYFPSVALPPDFSNGPNEFDPHGPAISKTPLSPFGI